MKVAFKQGSFTISGVLFVCLLLLTQTSWAKSQNSHEANNNYEYRLESAPAWVVAREAVTDTTDQGHNGVHYLLIDNQLQINKTSQTHFNHSQFKYIDYSALEQYGDVRIDFNPNYQVPVFHHIDIIRQGKRINQLSKDKIRFINSENSQDSNIYNGYVTALILIDDIRVGDVLDFSYSIVGDNPVFNNNVSTFFSLGYQIAIDRLFVRVLAPTALNLQYRIEQSDVQVTQNNIGANTEYQLSLTNTKAGVMEDSVPSWYSPYPWIQFSQYTSWREVSDWAYQLFQFSGSFEPKLAQFIAELKTIDRRQAIEKAVQFVQDDIRYLGLELGVNSHKPHHPNETFNSRYGDCKDKSLLLSQILIALGVDAKPGLVSTIHRAHLNQFLPSHSVFDHVIVNFTFEGQSYWIDPTRNYQGLALNTLHQPTYGQSLLIQANGQSLSQATPTKVAEQRILVTDDFYASDYGSPVVWTVKSIYQGKFAEARRYQLSTSSKDQIQRDSLNYYARVYPKIQPLADVTFTDDRVNNTFVITKKYLLPDFWTISDNKATFELFTNAVMDYLELPEVIHRQYPLGLYPDKGIEHKATLHLPEDVDFSELTRDQTFEDPYFKMRSQIRYDRAKLTLSNYYETKTDAVPVKDVAEHLRLIKQAREVLAFNGYISNIDRIPGAAEIKTLIKLLQKPVNKP